MRRSKVEPTIYHEEVKEIFAALRVDDMIMFGRRCELDYIMKELQRERDRDTRGRMLGERR